MSSANQANNNPASVNAFAAHSSERGCPMAVMTARSTASGGVMAYSADPSAVRHSCR
jgi:hypothetical protein